MKADTVVIHFLDGRLLKGATEDFFPPATTFHIRPADAGDEAVPACIRLADLKAVFFVRDLTGDSKYVYRNRFSKGQRFTGQKVRVTFGDGEVMVGWTMGYGEPGPGFFLFPADTNGNTQRVFVISANAREIAPQGP